MKYEIRSSFVKSVNKLPLNTRPQIAAIIETIELAKSIKEITNCKKLTGHKTAYRIKLGVYRIGFFYEKEIIELTTVMHRKEIYRYFPK